MRNFIPLFKLNYDQTEEKAVLETIRNGWISCGPKCAEFEQKFNEMIGIKYSVAVSNCTSALHLACVLLGIGRGDEVLCPSLTFVATANAIMYTGARPVFCDVEGLDNPTISTEEIKRKITEKTKCIMVMHYAGFPCEMDEIKRIADKNGLFIIEDACHAPLSEYKKNKLGTIGDVGCFSFFSNKNISTGEGGALVTNSREIFDKAKYLRSHGMTTMSYERFSGHAAQYDVVDFGYNYRMDDLRASLGIVQLEKIAKDIQKRSKIREKYLERLKKCDDIIIPFMDVVEGTYSNYIFPVVLRRGADYRDRIRSRLLEFGIQTSVHYPPAHLFTFYTKIKEYFLPQTEEYYKNEITLPMYSSLEDDEIDYICDKLIECINTIVL